MIVDCGYVLLSCVLSLSVCWNCVMSLLLMIWSWICFVRVPGVVDVVIVVVVSVDVVIVDGCYVVMIWMICCCWRICDLEILISLVLDWLRS